MKIHEIKQFNEFMNRNRWKSMRISEMSQFNEPINRNHWISMRIHVIKQFNESIYIKTIEVIENPLNVCSSVLSFSCLFLNASMKWINSMDPIIEIDENQWEAMRLINSMNPLIEIHEYHWESMKWVNSMNPWCETVNIKSIVIHKNQ